MTDGSPAQSGFGPRDRPPGRPAHGGPEFAQPSGPVPGAAGEDVTDITPGEDAGQLPSQRRRWTDQLSLRTRLIGVVAVLLSLALAVAGGLTVVTLQARLTDQVDRQLMATAKMMEHSRPDSARYLGPRTAVEFRTPRGQILYHNSFGNGEEPHPEFPAMTRTEASLLRGPFTIDSDDVRWRVMAWPAVYHGVPSIFYSAMPLTDVENTVSSVLARFAVFSCALLAALMALAYFAIGRAFRPLREVESVAVAFGEGDTSRRVQDVVPGTEVGRVGGSVNAMLDQIETTLAMREASEQRMRRFVGDASHELRTPLSTLRGFAELYRMGAVKGEANVSQTFRRIEDESSRMSHLVEDLLRLARLDEKRELTLTSVDLLVLASDAEHDAQALAPDRQVRVTGLDGAPEPGAGLVTGDERQLRQVVTNLMANAIRHTPAGTPVELGVGTRGNEVIFQVVDHGAGVSPELAEKIFERFFRADASRSRSSGGSGLGLAIVSAIVAAHHGSAAVRPTPGGGATFEVRLPARRPLTGNSQVQSSTPSARPR